MINDKTYFTLDNKFISNSKIGDFYKDKHYFYQRHVDGTIEHKVTDPMILGSAVDKWLTEGKEAFLREYIVVSRRTTSSPDYEYMLNPSMLETVEKICNNVENNDAFKALKGHTAQKILFKEMEIGIFCGLCGKPDWFVINGDSAIITDLKTAESANSSKYYFKCINYGYFRQMAMYDILIRHNYPEVKNVTYRHLVVEKDTDDIYNVFTFNLSPARIEVEKRWILETAIPEISAERAFAKKNATWEDAETIGEVFSEDMD